MEHMVYNYVRISESGTFTKLISENEAREILAMYYKDISFVGKNLFRLRTPYGYIVAMKENFLQPASGFYGVCGEWTPGEV